MWKEEECKVREIEEAKEFVEKFYLVFQPIMKMLSETESELYAYEVLLRSQENNCFPFEEFNHLIREENTNQILVEWYEKELKEYLLQYPHNTFDLNVHPQQLRFESTWEFLKAMQSFHHQLKIELTEYPPVFFYYIDYEKYDLNKYIKKVAELGYEIAIDDISCGQNTLDLVVENLEWISYFKFSLLSFRKLEIDITMSFLEVWLGLAQKYQLKFIVEGVESQEIMRRLYEKDVILQQGYYWSPGRKL